NEAGMPESFRWEDYDMAILDPDVHPDLSKVPDGFILIAYVSMGVAVDYRATWPKIKGQPWLTKIPGSDEERYYVDVRDPAWKSLLVKEVIPEILKKGFHGIFMDTLDVPLHLENTDPDKYRGSKKALGDLIHDIRRAYPDLILVSNNAFEILPEIVPDLTAVLAESLYGGLDSDTERMKPVSPERRAKKIALLNEVKRRRGLAVFSLDFAPESRSDLAEEYSRSSRRLGFKPYVAGTELDRVYPQTNHEH
ncbi:MAG: endo alpha-1,4 polygalactosaminidase, partial [Candidatus Omnitrophota bacterium]